MSSQDRTSPTPQLPDPLSPNPLRIETSRPIISRTNDADRERLRDLGRIAAASRIGNDPNIRYSADDAEAAIRALEHSTREGTLLDFPTILLGLRQVRRDSPVPVPGGGANGTPGNDNARALTRVIALAGATAAPGTLSERICTQENFCDPTPIGEQEVGSVLSPTVRPSPFMNPYRAITMGSGMASVMGYIATMESPNIALNAGETPAQRLAADRAELPNVDVVRANRAVIAACIRQPVAGRNATAEQFPLDLQDCTLAGSRAAIYNMAINGVTFQETSNPMRLEPMLNAPNARIARSGIAIAQ